MIWSRSSALTNLHRAELETLYYDASFLSRCIVTRLYTSHFLKITATRDYTTTYGDYTVNFVDYTLSRSLGDSFLSRDRLQIPPH
jgi:hypothetical protein